MGVAQVALDAFVVAADVETVHQPVVRLNTEWHHQTVTCRVVFAPGETGNGVCIKRWHRMLEACEHKPRDRGHVQHVVSGVVGIDGQMIPDSGQPLINMCGETGNVL